MDNNMPIDASEDILDTAKKIMLMESNAINHIPLTNEFIKAIEAILESPGRVLLFGLGKSGHIARKIASTFASTGTNAQFIHASEALHGDLGVCNKGDIAILISKSGETHELLQLAPKLSRLEIKTISITDKKPCLLSQLCNINLILGGVEECCPLGIAPTTSTTATLAIGDAIACILMTKRGFTRSKFFESHPGGAIGDAAFMYVKDIMIPINEGLPLCAPTYTFNEVLDTMTVYPLGIGIFVNADNLLLGLITDGDIRRIINKDKIDLTWQPYEFAMKKTYRTIHQDQLISEALTMMEKYKIMSLPVVNNENIVIGAFNIHQILRSKFI